jgi:hypothetical protein
MPKQLHGRGRGLLAGVAPSLFVLLFLDCVLAVAQTIRPVIAEFPEKAQGRFDLVNDSVVPLNVVLEAKSFSLAEDGSPTFRLLDKEIHLRLSAMSFRIPPQQTYYIFYEATADWYPAWFTVYARFAGLPQQSGLTIQVELPHTVYLLQKQPLEKSAVQLRVAEFVKDSKRVRVELENSSDRLGRVLQAEVIGNRARVSHPGFPLMPHSRRRFEIAWNQAEPPQKLLIRLGKFELEESLK